MTKSFIKHPLILENSLQELTLEELLFLQLPLEELPFLQLLELPLEELPFLELS